MKSRYTESRQSLEKIMKIGDWQVWLWVSLLDVSIPVQHIAKVIGGFLSSLDNQVCET